VSPVEERELARRLARVLDGEDALDVEARALAAVLERAAQTARLEVPDAEVERALAGARPRVRRPRRPALRVGIALAGVAVAAAVAIVLVILTPFTSAPGLDVPARAAAALGSPATVLSLVERITSAQPGLFARSARHGWLDLANGRARWTQIADGNVVAETAVEPGRFRRYLPDEGVVFVGASCRAFASGCAELVDPVAFYRDALERAGDTEAELTTHDGRDAYRLVLPVQALPNAVRIEQVVLLDAQTFLPLQIEWRDVTTGGRPRPFALIELVSIEVVPRDEVPASAFALEPPADVRVVERAEPGAVGSETALSLAEARRLSPPLLWLGSTYGGLPLEGIVEVELAGGSAYRLRYGDVTVWNYTTAVPPEVAAALELPAKTVPLEGGGVAHFYVTEEGSLVGEVEHADRSVALVGPQLGKVDLFRAIEDLRPLE
jgi:hypothetical protein